MILHIKQFLLQRYKERIEKLSQIDRLSKFCTDFITKDTEEFSQFTDSVACREYTLSREEEASQPKGSYWKLQLVACTANMELRSESCS